MKLHLPLKCPVQRTPVQDRFSNSEKWKGASMEPAVSFVHLGTSVLAYWSIRVPRVGSTSCALLEHWWYIGGMKLASFSLEL